MNGRPRKVVAVPSKQAWLYVFDRVTGEPIWPIEEKPVPKGDVPGRVVFADAAASARQAALRAQLLQHADDLIDFTPELRAEAIERLKRYKWAPTPFSRAMLGQRQWHARRDHRAARPPTGRAAATIPSCTSHSRRPATRRVRDRSSSRRRTSRTSATCRASAGQPFREVLGPGDCCAADSPRTAERAREARAPRRDSHAGRPLRPAADAAASNVQGLPIVKPPYGVLAAINLDRGELMWQAPHGDTPDNIRNHPALKGMNIPKTGQAGTSGVGLLVTKTLVDHGRSAGDDDAGAAARRDAARVRQEDRRSRSARCGCRRRRADRR